MDMNTKLDGETCDLQPQEVSTPDTELKKHAQRADYFEPDTLVMTLDNIDLLLTYRDTYWKERVENTRTALLFIGEKVLKEMSEIYAVDIKYADKKQWLEPSEFERIFLHRFNEAGLKALDTVIEKIKNK